MLQMGGVGPMLGQAHHFLRFNPGKAPYAEERFKLEAARLYGVLNARLADHEYLATTIRSPTSRRGRGFRVSNGSGSTSPRTRTCCAGISPLPTVPAVQRGYDVPAE